MERKKKEEKLKMKAEKEARKVTLSHSLSHLLFFCNLSYTKFRSVVVHCFTARGRQTAARPFALFVIGLVCFRCL